MSGAAAVSFNLAKFLPGTKLLLQVSRQPSVAEVDGVRIVTLGGFSESKIAKLTSLNNKIRRMVAEVVSFGADVVVLEGASWALYHRILLAQLRRALPSLQIVYHSHNVEFDLRSTKNNRTIAAVTRWAEGSLLRKADIATAVSLVDQSRFIELYEVKPALVPNGVDIDRLSSVSEASISKMRSAHGLDAHTILFSGFYAYPPNREAIDLLVKSIMPALRKRCLAANLALTGGGAPYHEPWIKNAGSVPYEDFTAFVAACGIAAAPIFSGSGTRLKVLEAMAAGLPVVASEKAVEGLGLIDGQHYLRATSVEEFLNAIALLQGDMAIAQRLRLRARAKVQEYSWRAIAQSFASHISTSLALPLHRRERMHDANALQSVK